MCLHTKQMYPEIAKKDIFCYIVVRKDDKKLFSFYRNAPITDEMSAKVKKRAEKEFFWSCNRSVNRGLHSFAFLQDAKDFKSEKLYFAHDILVIIKCVIPEGTKLYTGEFRHCKSYCSEQRNIVKIY